MDRENIVAIDRTTNSLGLYTIYVALSVVILRAVFHVLYLSCYDVFPYGFDLLRSSSPLVLSKEVISTHDDAINNWYVEKHGKYL